MSNATMMFLSQPLVFRSFRVWHVVGGGAVWPRSLFKEKMAALLVAPGSLKLPQFLSTFRAIPGGFLLLSLERPCQTADKLPLDS